MLDHQDVLQEKKIQKGLGNVLLKVIRKERELKKKIYISRVVNKLWQAQH
jgi:hypothetical protein